MIDEVRVHLDALARTLPCRAITGANGSVYLYRLTLAMLPDGGFLYLHRFMRSDEDFELHNHPWSGRSLILAGGYREERRFPNGTSAERHAALELQRSRAWRWAPPDEDAAEVDGRRTGHIVMVREYRRGDVNVIEPDTFHRVDLLEEDCWTLFLAGPKLSWGFWHQSTGVFAESHEFIARKTGDAQ